MESGSKRSSDRVRVLIVDDHRLFGELLMAGLSEDDRLEIVGIAATGQEAIDLVAQLEPHIVLMDLAMPVMDGLEATRRIAKAAPRTQVLVLTGESSVDAKAARDAGAAGFIRKDESLASLRESFFAVAGLTLAMGTARRLELQ
jgi:DNA-binding NarL/FixJ family response regulator